MKQKLQQHLKKNLPFLFEKKILVAISGGIDSVVLTHLLKGLNFDIVLAHCNFSLRGKKSNKDEQFVIDLGSQIGAKTHTIKFDTETYAKEHAISTQMAARELRYHWFQKICRKGKIDFIVTAHHKEDVLETFIINLTRGTGIAGLTGIPVINDNIIRPLLPFTRNEILIYATRNKLLWREDESNSSLKYVRNKIRNRVVPLLKELNPSILDSFTNTLEHLKGSQQVVQDYIQYVHNKVTTFEKNEIHFNIKKIKKLSNPKYYLYELLKAYGFTEWDDVVNLLEAQSGKQLLSPTHRLFKNRKYLVLTELKDAEEPGLFEIDTNIKKIKRPVSLRFEKIHFPTDGKSSKSPALKEIIFDDEDTVSIDLSTIEFPLVLRKWKKGDVFYPIGLNGQKKLSKFFKDEKYSLTEKDNSWLLCSKDEIVWVVGKRMDDRFKITPLTTSVLKIKYSRS